MLTHSNELMFTYFLLYFVMLSSQSTFFNSRCRHRRGKLLKIEIRDISSVPLKIRVIPEELIELISTCFSLQKYIFTMSFESFFYFDRNSIGQDSFASAKLHIDKIRRNEFILVSFFCDKFGLHMVVCN